MICDISKHQGEVDWDRLATELDFVILKASKDLKRADGIDPYYRRNAQACEARGVPYHAYHMLYARNEAEARTEAKLFARATEGTRPLFYVIDAERPEVPVKRARAICEAFEDGLRHYIGPDVRVAVYIGNHLYKSWDLDYSRYAYVWIPRYGGPKPDHPCDLWQYTSTGRAPGIDGNVDLDRLTGTKPMAFFTGTVAAAPAPPQTPEALQNGGDDDMLTSAQFVDFCKRVFAAKWVYWYGTYGNRCTEKLYKSKRNQYPTHYTDARKSAYMKDIAEDKTCADCVGLIKAFFWTGGVFGATPKYGSNNCPDKSANGMFGLCKETGPIATIPNEPGLVVWKSGHIGVYIGDGYTIEMRGFDYDCVKRKVKAGPWTKWGRLPASMLKYVDDTDTPSEPAAPAPQGLSRGDHGSAVKAMQKRLLAWDPNCLPKYGADGDFGSETEKAVKAFQAAAGLPVTGVCDETTRAALIAWQAPEDATGDGNAGSSDNLPREVEITGGSVNVRAAPGLNGKQIGVVHRGDRLPYQGETRQVDGRNWYRVEYDNDDAWVSGKYGRLVE